METFPDLLLLADFTNITSILVVIFCSLGMILFIYMFRMNGDLSHRTVDFGPHQRSMVKVSNPFVLDVYGSTENLQDDVRLSLSTLCPCHMVVVWGSHIQSLHNLILLPGRTIRKKMLTDLNQHTDLESLHWNLLQFDVEGKHTVALPIPECVSSEALGEMPRSRYPLAVFIFTPDKGRERQHEMGNISEGVSNNELTNDDEEEKDNEIIGLFTLIHLKDQIVNKDTHILAKYVKTAGVPIYSLQNLFVTSTNQPQHDPPHSSHQDDRPSQHYQHSSSQLSTSTAATMRQRKTSNHSASKSNDDDERTESAHLRHHRNVTMSSSLSASNSHDSKLHNPLKEMNHEDISSSSNVSLINQNNSSNEDSNTEFDELNCLDDLEHDIQPNLQSNSNNIDGEIENETCDCGSSEHTFNSDSGKNSSICKHIPDCVVCQSNPARCALLPCRHNCVCVRCLRLLDKCPMCRGVLESYFIVRDQQDADADNNDGDDDDDGEDEDEDQDRVIRQDVAARIENMFERVNQMVGFA